MSPKKSKSQITPLRPWRICPLGASFVKEHTRKTKSGDTIIKSHCRISRIKKEILNLDEILEIFHQNIDRVFTMPHKSRLGYKGEDQFDELIGLWTAFWNDTFKVEPPLDPNWVKVLIATESGFKPNSVNPGVKNNVARGLMQITENTYRILTDSKGELKDVLFRIDQKDLFLPDVGISTGIRWLFRKREILKSQIGRDPAWEEVMWEYKGIFNQSNPRATDIKTGLKDLYEKIYLDH